MDLKSGCPYWAVDHAVLGDLRRTKNGLPFFGPHPQHGPRMLFAMTYGGNGIIYSTVGTGLLRAAIEHRQHPLARLFSFAGK
jgi:glycine/D-amino acid oxidase-like deaminating enzyme